MATTLTFGGRLHRHDSVRQLIVGDISFAAQANRIGRFDFQSKFSKSHFLVGRIDKEALAVGVERRQSMRHHIVAKIFKSALRHHTICVTRHEAVMVVAQVRPVELEQNVQSTFCFGQGENGAVNGRLRVATAPMR